MTDTKKSLERSSADADPAKVGGAVIRLNDEEHEAAADEHSAETRIGQMAASAIQELMRTAEGGGATTELPQINERSVIVEEATAQVPAAALLAGLKGQPSSSAEPTPASGTKRVLPKPPGAKTDAPAPPPAPNRSSSKAPPASDEVVDEDAPPASVPRVYDDVSEDDASTRIHPDAKEPLGTRGQTVELTTADFLAEPATDAASPSDLAPPMGDAGRPLPYGSPNTRERHWTDYTVIVAIIGLITLAMILALLFYLWR